MRPIGPIPPIEEYDTTRVHRETPTPEKQPYNSTQDEHRRESTPQHLRHTDEIGEKLDIDA